MYTGFYVYVIMGENRICMYMFILIYVCMCMCSTCIIGQNRSEKYKKCFIRMIVI